MAAKILAFAGSTRSGSFNKKLVQIAARGAKQTGATVTLIDLRDFPMPLYDGDLESSSGLPDAAKKLKTLFKEHQGFLISSPEYNSGYSGVLKNTIDWCSRTEPGEPNLVCFTGKTAALMSASPGALGGLRGLVQLRQLLSNINVLVLPDQKSISNASEAFDDEGNLKNPKDKEAIEALGVKLSNIILKISG